MCFVSDIKKELYKITDLNNCCKKAELYAFFLFSDFFYDNRSSFKPKNENMFNLFIDLAKDDCLNYFNIDNIDNKKILIIKGAFEKNKLFSEFGYNTKIVNLRINQDIFSSPCCLKAFLGGAFLMCGKIHNPYKTYKLEFKIPYKNLAQDLANVISGIQGYDFNCKISQKQGGYTVYIYGAENLENFLALIGASQATMKLMQIKMVKDERNHLNRITNFDVANIERVAKAVADQLNSINKLKTTNVLDTLDDKLKHVAMLRLEYPESSLEELHKISGISKSSINYRLHRLIDIANDLN